MDEPRINMLTKRDVEYTDVDGKRKLVPPGSMVKVGYDEACELELAGAVKRIVDEPVPKPPRKWRRKPEA